MQIHKYHFLITENLKNELNMIEELFHFSFSGKINFIIKKSDDIFKFTSFLKIDEESKVEHLNENKDIQLYIKKSLFKKIKKYHGRLNSYSIAVIVRLIIRIFLKMIEVYGFKGALKKLKKETRKLKKIYKSNNKKYITVQLMNFLRLQKNKNLKLLVILEKLLL
jgi:hypothetical protein